MKYTINLLEEKKSSLIEGVVYFFFNYLRYVIVITQLVVIGVFFYRFRVDQNIIDLKESVDQKKEIIQVVLPLLKQAEQIDRRTKEIKNILEDQVIIDSMVVYLLNIFPETITLNNMEINTNNMKITGVALDPKHLQAFYGTLKKEGKFQIVNMQNLNKTEEGYSFAMELKNFGT